MQSVFSHFLKGLMLPDSIITLSIHVIVRWQGKLLNLFIMVRECVEPLRTFSKCRCLRSDRGKAV